MLEISWDNRKVSSPSAPLLPQSSQSSLDRAVLMEPVRQFPFCGSKYWPHFTEHTTRPILDSSCLVATEHDRVLVSTCQVRGCCQFSHKRDDDCSVSGMQSMLMKGLISLLVAVQPSRLRVSVHAEANTVEATSGESPMRRFAPVAA